MTDDPRVTVNRGVPPPPALPAVESPPSDAVLDGVPSKEDVTADAAPVEEIMAGQPSVDDVLGRRR